MNDFCPTCMLDYDAMTIEQRAAHRCVTEYVVRTCDGRWFTEDVLAACQEALENAGSDLEHTDHLRLDFMRAAATALCDAFADDLSDHVPLVEDLVSVLDDATIMSDNPDADVFVVRRLHAAIGVTT